MKKHNTHLSENTSKKALPSIHSYCCGDLQGAPPIKFINFRLWKRFDFLFDNFKLVLERVFGLIYQFHFVHLFNRILPIIITLSN
ncbi:hypothetical protein CW713_02385 [Methanophagales archaeon]|nr:MAG: hypothetical protein CW713_02385 [Methanophagales archaeon]